jgi:hypothetical protein
MPTTKRLTIETVNLDDPEEFQTFMDQVISAGMERVRAEVAELQRRGILDEKGNLLIQELPPDMREGADRDFGG